MQRRFVHVGQQQPIHEEAGPVVHHDRRLAERLGVGDRRGDRGVAGLLAANHFHQRHLADRVEKVQAAEAVGMLQPVGQLRDRNRRRVRAEDRIVAHQRLEPSEELLLGVAFSMIASTMMSEWHSSMSESVPFTSGASSTARFTSGPLICLLYATSFKHTLHAAGERFSARIHDGDRDAALDVGRRDALPHHAGADNAGRRNLVRLDALGDTGVFLVAVGEEEHIQQRPIDRRAEELGEFLGLHLAGGFEIDAGRAEHQLERRERGRVVALGLLLDVGARGRAEEAELRVADRDRPGPALAVAAEVARLLLEADHADRGGDQADHDRRRSSTTSFARPIAAAARGSMFSPLVTSSTAFERPTIRGVASRAAPAGKQAELHFRKAVGGFFARR